MAVGLIPVAVVLVVLWRWSIAPLGALVAVGRMLVQLLLVGYVLTAIFYAERPWIVLLALGVMLVAAANIALRSATSRSWRRFAGVVGGIAFGSLVALATVTQGVLAADPWFEPRVVVSLAGMAIASAMNSVGLAAERYDSERALGRGLAPARSAAFRAAMIPAVNSLLAVGLVSLPGTMTGQILEGADPLNAARYQIVVMCMVFSASGLATALFLGLEPVQPDSRD